MSPRNLDVSDILEWQILFGELKPRERLVEEEIITRLNVTRHQARQALTKLEQRGLVVRVANRGAHVRDFSEEDVRQICAVREMLHAQAASLIPLPASPALIAELEQHQTCHADAVAAGDLKMVHRANNAFHATLFGACGNSYLAQTIADYAAMSLAFRCHLMAIPYFAERAVKEHRQMVAALVAGDRAELIRLCMEHTRPAQDVYRRLRGWASGNLSAGQERDADKYPAVR